MLWCHPGHPLTLCTSAGVGDMEAHPAWGPSRRLAGAWALLSASVMSCLMQRMLCWSGCWRQSWIFCRSCCLVLEKHVTREVFLWNFILEGGVHMHTHYHKWPQEITDILSEKYMGFFWVSHFLRFSCLWPKEDGIFPFQATDSHNTCYSPSLKPRSPPIDFLCLSLPLLTLSSCLITPKL